MYDHVFVLLLAFYWYNVYAIFL